MLVMRVGDGENGTMGESLKKRMREEDEAGAQLVSNIIQLHKADKDVDTQVWLCCGWCG